ncbi:MAG: glycosyltransferase family 9 protein [Candidatus Aminicenantales bacterium]
MNLLEFSLTRFSRLSAEGIDLIIKKIASSPHIHNLVKKQEKKKLEKLHHLKNILILGDMNIGDAVNIQSFINPLKHTLPEVNINYIYSQQAYPLVRDHPSIDNHFPVFRSFGLPSRRDYREVRKILKKNRFDLIINLSPFFSQRDLRSEHTAVLMPIRLIGNIISAIASEKEYAHIAYQLSRFANEIGEKIHQDRNNKTGLPLPFQGTFIYLSSEILRRTERIMSQLGIHSRARKILFNPDTSSRFTQIPFSFQLELLKGILPDKNLDQLLLSSGFTFKGIEKRLDAKLPSHLRKKVILIPPTVSIEEYTALIDRCQLFISGDTGPLHLAAARKIVVHAENQCRNSTAVVNIFGATDSRIYGYDSSSGKHLPANQNAPSRVFEGKPRCKNLTCIHKLAKKCSKVRCFEGLEPAQVIDYVRSYLSSPA